MHRFPRFPLPKVLAHWQLADAVATSSTSTPLADDGSGSLREAVSHAHRTVVFDVAGVIELKSNIAVSSDVTIAGQSAPGAGIVLYGHSISLSGQHNIILRYLRCRQGIHGDRGKCSINMADTHNAIIDHCSVEWGRGIAWT